MRIPVPTRFLFALVLCLAACRAQTPAPEARPGPRFLTDAGGRALILRGTNVESAAKSAPLHAHSLTDDEIRLIARDMGFNLVRYLVFWDGLEPQPGRYDEAYLDRIVADVDRFAAQGLWVLVDVHQDVYASRFCCDGAPEWAIRDDGEPFELQESWSFNYFQPAVRRAFDNFWAYTDGGHADLQDHYVAMLRRLAARLRNHPAVLGYDVMNEPHPGSEFDTIEVVTREDSEQSRDFDRERLQPFYQRAINAIREADGEKFIFFEPRYGAPGNGSPSWLPPLVDPRAGESRLGYAPHLYSLPLEANGVYAEDDPTLSLWETRRTEEIARQQMPLLLGEWGLAFSAAGSDRYVTELVEMGERMLLSWAHWSWDPGGPQSWALYDRATKTFNPMFHLVDRPYPRATAGEPTELRFDAASRTLHYTWRERSGVKGETEVFVPMARENPAEYVVELSDPQGTWSYEWDDRLPGLLRIKANAGSSSHELVVRPSAK